jgi:hypothetical protein
MTKRLKALVSPLGRCNAGGDVGPLAILTSMISRAVAGNRLFPPADEAIIVAMACEVVAETELPLSRQSIADLTSRANKALGKPISSSTVWRMLHEHAIKPWQYEHWIFPRDPLFAEKAGRVLDLYAGSWEGKPLGPKDYVLSSDEKTSIQARKRRHGEQPPGPKRTRRIETEYKRKGALQYLATWDVRRGIVMGRCESRTGIRSFGRMVTQIRKQEVYRDAERLFLIVDNGSSHRGQRSVARQADYFGAHADPCELAESGGDLFFDHPAKGADAERFREFECDPAAAGVVRGVEQSPAEAVRMEVHSTGFAGMAKTCVAAFFSSFRCLREGT